MKLSWKASFGTAALIVALAASGCSTSKSGTEEGGESSNTVTGDNGISTDAPKMGGELKLGLEAATTGGLCIPDAQLAAAGIMMAQPIFEPLVAYDDKFEAQPYLAKTIEVSSDFTEYTFHLREGIKFHDGSALDAQLVKDNMERWRKSALLGITMKPVKDITVVDPLTLKVTNNQPWNGMLGYLAGGRAGIIGRAQLDADADTCAKTWIGTGPFAQESWAPNQPAVYKKNPNYWRKDKNGVQLPYLDKITMVPIEGSIDRQNQLLNKQLNIIQTSSALVRAEVTAKDGYAEASEPAGYREVAYGLPNLSRAPFNDLNVRTAFAQALDKEQINQIANEGEFTIANQPFDVKTTAFVPDSELDIAKYNPEEAAKVLRPMNIQFTLVYATDPIIKRLAEYVKKALGDVGVTVNITVKEQSALITTAIGGDYDLLLFRNHPGADPDTQYNWWHSGSILNFSHITDAEVDKYLDEGRRLPNGPERTKAYQNLSKRLAEQYLGAWNYYTEWFWLYEDNVKNVNGAYLPDGQKAALLHWGWADLSATWIDK